MYCIKCCIFGIFGIYLEKIPLALSNIIPINLILWFCTSKYIKPKVPKYFELIK